jgi:hypothetical protein
MKAQYAGAFKFVRLGDQKIINLAALEFMTRDGKKISLGFSSETTELNCGSEELALEWFNHLWNALQTLEKFHVGDAP